MHGRLRRRELTESAPLVVGCQGRRPRERRNRNRGTAVRPSPLGRSLELLRNRFVRSERGRGEVPGAAVGVALLDQNLRQSPVHVLPQAEARAPVDGGANERMPELDAALAEPNET